jgi:DNA-binding Lrp family transcriptional regulator
MNNAKTKLKNTEIRLISELMKNNRRSDRRLAKALNVSQPTVTRTMGKLEKEGLIKEQTIIPDFKKLGIQLVAIVFGAWSPEKIEDYSEDECVNKARKFLLDHPNVVFASSGRGLGKERMMISLHKDYSDYSEFMSQARAEWAGLVQLESFIISLETDVMPLPFSLRNMGKYIEKVV